MYAIIFLSNGLYKTKQEHPELLRVAEEKQKESQKDKADLKSQLNEMPVKSKQKKMISRKGMCLCGFMRVRGLWAVCCVLCAACACACACALISLSLLWPFSFLSQNAPQQSRATNVRKK